MAAKEILRQKLVEAIEEWHSEDPENREVKIALKHLDQITDFFIEEITRTGPASADPWRARGTRVDDMGDGTYRILHFGLFSACEGSKELIMSLRDALNLFAQLRAEFEPSQLEGENNDG
ncbi:MAG: hypothetical protein AMJ56_07585 [Anaerolineae bacterium SG8_19]|nr:MAG: hypothetical protein AMJ56_07585 [Anaerolineae bacterium SG8_19]